MTDEQRSMAENKAAKTYILFRARYLNTKKTPKLHYQIHKLPLPMNPITKVFCFLALCIPAILFSQDPETEEAFVRAAGFYIYSDQDVLVNKFNEDRNYTMGLHLGAFGPFADKNYLAIPYLRKKIDHFFGFDSIHCENDFLTRASITLYGSGYTPLDIAQSEPIIGDRPYASLLMLGAAFLSVNEPSNYSLLTEFNIGALGLGHAREAQSYIHRNHWLGSTRPIPQGWHNQISEGGEPTVLYRVVYRRLWFENDWKKYFRGYSMHRFQLIGIGEAMLGYYTNAAFGVEARAGLFSNPFWDMISGTSTGMSQYANPKKKPPFFEAFAYGALRSRLVGYNALLQGQFRSTAYRMNASAINRLIGEYEWGLGLRLWNVQLLWGIQAGRSAEYSGDFARPHIWGTAMIRVNWTIEKKEEGSPCDYSQGP